MQTLQVETSTSQRNPRTVLERFLERLDGVVPSGGSWAARCPAHDDRNPSLSVKLGYCGLLLKCWAGCPTQDVLRAIDLDFQDLFYEHPAQPGLLKETRENSTLRPYRWNWRRQTNELLTIGEVRQVLAEDFLTSLRGTAIDVMPDADFYFFMEHVSLAKKWITLGENITEFVFEIRRVMRAREARDAKR